MLAETTGLSVLEHNEADGLVAPAIKCHDDLRCIMQKGEIPVRSISVKQRMADGIASRLVPNVLGSLIIQTNNNNLRSWL